MNAPYFLYILNTLLASAVFGLCLVKTNWRGRVKDARDFRVAGLGLVALAIVWGSLARRHEDLKPWHFVVAIGLSLCVYGMSKFAKGEVGKD